jgi:UDP-GlcNAc:undecaprenyl-phosphate GlcNAc-1-phosphate transferase
LSYGRESRDGDAPEWVVTSLVAVALFAFVLATVATPACKRLATYLDVFAHPDTERWHRTPVPLLGGVAIFAAVVVPTVLVAGSNLAVWGLLGGSSALFVLGLVDDIRPFKPQVKVVGQILVASAMVSLGLELRLTSYALLNIAITLVWIVGITNAFNLLDNMDGLAAGIAIITAGFRLTFFLMDGNASEALLAAILVGALLGFLIYNWHPASIFMGDAGSLFVGCYIAGLSLIGGWPYSRGITSVLVFPVLILLVPIFDTTFVTITRTLANRPISVGGRDHTSHRLVALGLSEPKAVAFFYGVAILSGLVALFSYQYGLSYSLVFIAFLVIGLIIFGVYIATLRVHPERGADVAASGLTRIFLNFPYKKQITTVILDLLLIALAYNSAYLLRFESAFDQHEAQFLQSLPLVIVCQMLLFAMMRMYQGVWRYTSLSDMIRLIQATSLGVVASLVAIVFAYRFEDYSRSVFIIYWALLLLFVASSRASFRVIGEFLQRRQSGATRVVIYGAGDGGVLALREILNNASLGRDPAGFIDDDPAKWMTKIQGYDVFGGLDNLEEVIRSESIAEVVVASTKVMDAQMDVLAATCEACGVSLVRASLQLE